MLELKRKVIPRGQCPRGRAGRAAAAGQAGAGVSATKLAAASARVSAHLVLWGESPGMVPMSASGPAAQQHGRQPVHRNAAAGRGGARRSSRRASGGDGRRGVGPRAPAAGPSPLELAACWMPRARRLTLLRASPGSSSAGGVDVAGHHRARAARPPRSAAAVPGLKCRQRMLQGRLRGLWHVQPAYNPLRDPVDLSSLPSKQDTAAAPGQHHAGPACCCRRSVLVAGRQAGGMGVFGTAGRWGRAGAGGRGSVKAGLGWRVACDKTSGLLRPQHAAPRFPPAIPSPSLLQRQQKQANKCARNGAGRGRALVEPSAQDQKKSSAI